MVSHREWSSQNGCLQHFHNQTIPEDSASAWNKFLKVGFEFRLWFRDCCESFGNLSQEQVIIYTDSRQAKLNREIFTDI